MKLKMYNQSGGEEGTIEVSDAVFGLKWNADLVHQVVTGIVANQRVTVAHVKDRSEVRGGGKKPWRQKGTGRARHGSIRSPIWKGGGVTHGPLGEKNYAKKINKKMAARALRVVLSAKARDHEIIVVSDMQFSEPKTKQGAQFLMHFASQEAFQKMKRGNGVLVALPERDDTARRVLKNIPFVKVDETRNLNAHEVLQYRYLLFPKSSLEVLSRK